MSHTTTVHTYRAPLVGGPGSLRLYAGTPASGYAVDTFCTATAREGVRVYRDAKLNSAVLWLDAGVKSPQTHMLLDPRALRELAGRLLDAAHDIEQHPAASLAPRKAVAEVTA
jgi:hypothetical protein